MRKTLFAAAAALLVSAGLAFATQVINDNLQINGSLIGQDNGGTVSPRTFNACGGAAQLAADGNNSTPVVTEVYLSEVFVPYGTVVTGVALFNGSDVTGNVKVGLYNAAGTLLATSASTAGSGVDSYQRVPFTAPIEIAGPATYYTASFYDSGTARYNTTAVGSCGAGKLTGQVFATGFPESATMPTTFTTALGNIAALY